MFGNTCEIILVMWWSVGAVWLLTVFRVKPAVRGPKSTTRIWEILCLTSAAGLLFAESPHLAPLDARWIPADALPVGVGIALTTIGVAFAIRSEERLLMSRFGDRYVAYRREVRGAIAPYVI